MVEDAKAVNVDASRLVVAADSAGGNMAAAVTMLAKERKGPQIRHQVLFYPVTDDVSENSSYRSFGECPWLFTKAMHYFRATTKAAEAELPVRDLRHSPELRSKR
jgi:acetyl esterase